MLIPIRVATLLMTSICTLLSVSIALVVSIVASNQALVDVKDSQDSNVQSCFTSGEDNLVEITKDKLGLLATKVELSVQMQLDDARRVNTILTGLSLTLRDPSTQVQTLESAIIKLWDSTKISILGLKGGGMVYTLIENSLAYAVNSQLGYRQENSTTMLTYNDSAPPANIGMLDHLDGTYSSQPCNLRELLAVWTGTVASGPCPFALFVPDEIPFVAEILAMPNDTPPNWSPIVGFSTYVGVMIRARVTRDPSQNDLTMTSIIGFDLKSISVYLEEIVSPLGDERIFVTVGGDQKQTGLLIGTSHGSWHIDQENQPDPLLPSRNITVKVPRHCTNATDEVIQGVSTWLYSQVPLGTDVFAAQLERQKEKMPEVTVNGTVYYLEARPLTDEYGLEWWVVVTVEKQSVVGATQARREATIVGIKNSNSHVDKSMQDKRIILICVVVGVTLLLMVLTAVATSYLTNPLEVLSNEMWDVAQLRLDDVDEKRKKSFLLEVNSMQRSFILMLCALREYRQFMPQGIAEMVVSESDCEAASDDASDTNLSTPARSSASGGEFTSPSYIDRRSSGTGSESTKKYKKNYHANHALALNMVRKKCVSQVSVENPDFERFLSVTRDGPAIVEYHSQWLQRCIMDVKNLRGMVERFIGDHVDVNFGGIMPCTAPSAKAANYAVKLRERVGAPPDIKSIYKEQHMFAGISTGACYAGNLGCQGMKAPTTLGRTFTQARSMMLVARDIGLDIVMDGKCSDELKGMFTTTIVDILKVENRGKVLCYYANGFKKDVGGEWMYTMKDEGEACYDAAWTHILGGDIKKGLEDLRGITPADPVTNIAISRIAAYCETIEKATGKPPGDYYRVIANRAVNGPLTEQYLPFRMPVPSRQHVRGPRSPLGASIVTEPLSPVNSMLQAA
eukprot:TRINITY_DN1309_c0_g1_i5.p1 TRINITY_DN1309_c0_g1~~TRINITY_DN1309_c0_g1_i5.p1  ORF type:complete len:926 (+),score=308.24 TRINITY_DN1309_c0_g1_i5:59-2779(+)